jgi:hypothetical protein
VGQEAAGFQATHIYRLTCPEGMFDVQVKLVAAESKRSRQPQWHIPSQPTPNITVRAERVSQYGRAVAELQFEGDAVAKAWLSHLSANRWLLAQTLTTPRAHRDPIELAVFRANALGGGPASVFPLRPEFLPPDRAAAVRSSEPPATTAAIGRLSFDDLAASGFFRRDAAGTALASDKLAQLRDLWPQSRLMPPMAERMAQAGMAPAGGPVISFTPDALQVTIAAELLLDQQGRVAKCVIGLESTAPALIAALDAARARGPDAVDDGSMTARTLPARDWRVAWLRTDMEPHASPAGPGGPPGMGGPPGG